MTPYHRPVAASFHGAWPAILALALMTSAAAAPETTPAPKFRVGTIRPDAVRESSGIVASRKHPGVYWTHNDSGNSPALYAITGDGQLIGEYAVAAKNDDWEDVAIDDAGRLYIADTGNNAKNRKEMLVLRVDEPDPRAAREGRAAPLRVATAWRLAYPDPKNRFDCEALFAHAGHGYLIPKRRDGSIAEVYRFPFEPVPDGAKVLDLERVCELPAVRAPVTAADLSPDGKRLAVLTVFGPYLFELPDAGNVASAAKAEASFSRYVDPVMEAACLTPEGLLVTTESRAMFLFRAEHFKPVE